MDSLDELIKRLNRFDSDDSLLTDLRLFLPNYKIELEKRIHEISSLKTENHELKQNAGKDPLTQLLNKTALFVALDAQFKQAARHGTGFSVIMADLDGFKSYNDTYGHLQGDKGIKTMAHVMQGNVRNSDTVSKYGGEEFVAILPEANQIDSMLVAENIRSSLEKAIVPPAGNQMKPGYTKITGSFGVFAYSPELNEILREVSDNPSEAALTLADIAMYHSKANGKNKVTAYELGMQLPVK